MDPVVGAAALTAAAGLLQGLMQQEAARKQAQQQKEEAARQRLDTAQRQQIALAGSTAAGERDAIGNLLAALRATAR